MGRLPKVAEADLDTGFGVSMWNGGREKDGRSAVSMEEAVLRGLEGRARVQEDFMG